MFLILFMMNFYSQEMGKGEDDADGLNHVQLRDGVMGIQRPMSVQPTRRNKTNTMPNSLRRI